MPAIRFVKLSPAALAALVEGDLEAASQAAGTPLSQYLIDENWLWRVRLDDIANNPEAADWIARPALADPDGIVVGHGGFHGPPDTNGVVEVAYSVDPGHRRRGYAKAMLRALLERADADPRVTAVRASIRPDNIGSRATIKGFGFKKIGEQWDREEGLEDVYLRPARPAAR
ncbi:GNAT family N-acetyltransferase [Actinoplanes oblitus]|uniref:GNAT family N-acetyltransferase n=1 Tax=Actinoplanes oblitus TaxID=3040509 RepID=A0ABY8WAF5_9ACTN|nr:GNAT family N-acetyltransferase [Actinoplanes oblitus]WIM92700.1 GNAT family N-acetyltransferase [Actinoplanes oblitus]